MNSVSLWIVSDMHCDVSSWSLDTVPAHDVTVIAGDVADGPERVGKELRRLHTLTGKPIVYVPGNHCFSGTELRGDAFADLASIPVLVLQHGSQCTIKGVRFIGATLWTDFELTQTEFASQRFAVRAMPEYRTIKTGGRLVRPIDLANEHDADLSSLELSLTSSSPGPVVVVTHHAPSRRSLPDDYSFEAGASFASDLEVVIKRFRPALWVHGHIHGHADYSIGDTRIVSNARGYPGQEGWREDFVVDVPVPPGNA